MEWLLLSVCFNWKGDAITGCTLHVKNINEESIVINYGIALRLIFWSTKRSGQTASGLSTGACLTEIHDTYGVSSTGIWRSMQGLLCGLGNCALFALLPGHKYAMLQWRASILAKLGE
jgi:hypothetical protein